MVIENGANTSADILIENPELLNCSHDKIQTPTTLLLESAECSTNSNNINSNPQISISNGFGVHSSESAMSSNSTPSKIITKQSETRTADGKRRITPMFIPLNQDERYIIIKNWLLKLIK